MLPNEPAATPFGHVRLVTASDDRWLIPQKRCPFPNRDGIAPLLFLLENLDWNLSRLERGMYQPAAPFTFVDHATVLVACLQTARERFIEAGFLVTPASSLGGELGLENACVIFDDEYLELTAVATPTAANRGYRELLATRGEGLAAIAYRAGSAQEDLSYLASRHDADARIIHFHREVSSRDGVAERLSFSVCVPPIEPLASGVIFYSCEHHTPELLWERQWSIHPNGARRFCGITIASADIPERLSSLKSLFPVLSDTPDGSVLLPSQFPLAITARSGAATICLGGRNTSIQSFVERELPICGISLRFEDAE